MKPDFPEKSTADYSPQKGYGVAAWALWAYFLISIGRLGELIPGLSGLPLAKLAIGISLLALLARRSKQPAINGTKTGIVGTAIALAVLAVMLIPISIAPGASFKLITSVGLPLAVSFYITTQVCSSWHHLRMTLLVLVVTALILATTALTGSSGRVSAGDSYDSNDLAYVLVTCLPLALAFGYTSRGRNKLVFYGMAGLLLVATLLTQSRGGLLGLLGAIILLVVHPFNGQRRSLFKVLIVSATLATLGVGAFSFLPADTQERFATLGDLKSDYNMDANNVTGRTSIWRRGIQAALDRPIGYGPATFQAVDLMTGGRYKTPHNSLLQVAVELGLLGLALYIGAQVQAWLIFGTLTKIAGLKNPEQFAHTTALRAALVANFIAAFFLSQAFSAMLWTILALAYSMQKSIYSTPLKMKARSNGIHNRLA